MFVRSLPSPADGLQSIEEHFLRYPLSQAHSCRVQTRYAVCLARTNQCRFRLPVLQKEPQKMTEPAVPAILPTLNLTDDADTIVLGRSPVTVVVGSDTFSGSAEARLDLVPRPSVYVYCTFENPNPRSAVQTVLSQPEAVQSLALDGSQLDGFITKSNCIPAHPDRLELTWCPTAQPIQALGVQTTQLQKLLFHLFNFDFQGRPGSIQRTESSTRTIEHIDLDSETWKVRIRSLAFTREHQESIKEKGGYRLTHVGEVSKTDGSPFSGQDASSILETLKLFLCFANGSQCIPTCPSGVDASGNQVWSQWSSPIEWERVPLSWFDRRYPDLLSDLFPHFMDKMAIGNWRDALSDAIWWYVRANQSSRGIDAGIVFAQTAIERLSYEYAVCEMRLVEKQGFESLRASDQYRLLLSSLGIPLDIPSSAKALTAAAQQKGRNWLDAPHALTQIRNDFVHVGKVRTTLSNECYVEAWKLTVWILEMAILALCDFRGKHWNRNNRQTEVVPWAHHS